MYVVSRSKQFLLGLLLSYGPKAVKRRVWDKEYSGDKWDFADNTAGDCVYAHLEKHAANGSILDLGCGSGNTATELATSAYKTYLGVDISEEALNKARRRSKEAGRLDKNRFESGDFLAYVPAEKYDVILFRESMYHVPIGRVKAILERYSKYLKEGGVFVVRMFAASRETSKSKYRPTTMLGIIEAEFDVVEKCQYADMGRPTVIVIRPKCAAAVELENHQPPGTQKSRTAVSHR
jgi:2-polyprenyl-3-methyl-5-hydroxy-6-metoxy-1,4-benzoquinol methylase